MSGGGGEGFIETNFQLLMLSSNLLKSKIPMSGWEGGFMETNFQLLMLSSNLLKSKIPMSRRGGGVWWNQLSTFDAESKFASEKKSFRAKMGRDLFWTFSTKWFAYTKYRRTTIISHLRFALVFLESRDSQV